MENFKEEYDELLKQKEKVVSKIEILEQNEAVKEYLVLKKQNEDLSNKQLSLYKKMKNKEYSSCNHILVYSEISCDRYEGRTYRKCGCIKCGLDESVLDCDKEYLPLGKQIMYDFLKKYYIFGEIDGLKTEIACDLDLAHSIYLKIKEVNPDISDETTIKYFTVALNDIRNVRVNDERKISRSKRLSLNRDFKSWNATDVYTDYN